MLKKIINRLKYLFYCVWKFFSPIGFARHVGVKVGKNVTFYGMKPNMFSTEPWLVTIGDNCYITAGCQFITHDGGTLILRREIPDLELTAPIELGNNVYVGVDTTFLPGTRIGDCCIIGACSVVKGDFPAGSVLAGNPARIIKTVEEYKNSAIKKSLHLGDLKGKEKEKKLKEYFNIK